MGAGASGPVYIPNDSPPPTRAEADYPVVDPTGIGKGMAQGCQQRGGGVCQLAVPHGVSSSGAKLYRDEGAIRRDLCRKYGVDIGKVSRNEKAFEEVKKDLIAGLYYEDLNNGYCRQMVYDAEDLKAVRSPDKLPMDKVRYMSVRKMSDSGSYSSVTKLFIKPSIPFEVEFNGKKHSIKVLTLMHPSPIRVENIQHDAMLTLGDPGDGNNDGLVILVPLQGAITAGASGAFVSKMVRYMTGVLQPDPATGDYKAIDIPTGNDWDISKLFPGSPGEDGKTFVTNIGYYVWSGYPPLELQPEGSPTPYTDRPWFSTWYFRTPGVQRYVWKPKQVAPVRYVMLSRPALVTSMDLQTIRMLPVTPVTEALAPILKHTLSYRNAGKVGPDGTWETVCPAPSPTAGAITDLFSSSTRERLENPQCDPFAPGNFPQTDTREAFIQAAIVFFTAIAVGLAIYLAVLFFTKTKWGQMVAKQGTVVGNYVSQSFQSDARKMLPVNPLYDVSEAQEAQEEEEAAKKEADYKAADAAITKSKEDRDAKQKEDKEKDEKRKASLAAFNATRRTRTATGAKEAESLVKPEDVVVEDKLPPPGTPAAAAVAQAGEEITAPPAGPSAVVTNDVLPTSGPAAAAVAQAEPQPESRADMYRRRAKEAAERAKADAATKPKPRSASFGAVAPTSASPIDAAVARKSERARVAELVAKREAEDGKIEQDYDAAAEEKKALDHARMLAASLPPMTAEGKKAAEKSAEELATMAKEAKERTRKAEEAADDAKLAAEEAAKKPKPKTTFATAASANGPSPIEAAVAKKEAAAAKKAADEAAEKEAEIKRLAEETAKRLSAAAERRAAAAPPKPPASLAEPIMKPRPKPAEIQSDMATTNPMLAKKTANPKEVKTTLTTLEKDIKAVKDLPKPAQLSANQEAALTDADKAAARKLLETLRDKVDSDLNDARQREAGILGQAKDGASAWRQFENEKKLQTLFALLNRNLTKFAEGIETSKLPQTERLEFIKWLESFKKRFLELLTRAKTRIESFQIVVYTKGGRRGRRQRKSTRRYVA